MKTCSICSHPERAAIDAALVDKTSLRVIAGQYGTNKSALDRHRKHVPAALTVAKQAEEVAEATTLLSRVERLMSRMELACNSAMEQKEWMPAVAASRELRGCLELLAKLTGELQSKGPNVTNLNFFNDQGEFCFEMLSDDELNTLFRRVSGGVPAPETLRHRNVFDEITIPPFDLDGHRRHRAICLQVEANMGWDHGWNSGVTSDAEGRFKMLAAAWKREAGENLPDSVSMRDFGDTATIELEFDLTRSSQWPQARLIAGGRLEHKALPAHPSKTIKGIR